MKSSGVVVFLVCIMLSLSGLVDAGPQETYNAGELQIALEKLNVLGSVLYLAAHPDDENTSALAWLSKGRKYRTAYLSLTRGDGGQNLIGPEKGPEIGMIRTQELLAARRIDGAEQFFSRAKDFGYSKNPEETLAFWGHDEILADVVRVIRKFRPDIIISRFPPGSGGGHGHHTASASLAREAFDAAADPTRFPEQLQTLKPWQVKRLFWNSWRPGREAREKLMSADVGEYNQSLGMSYTELAALSRSMHKTQGFGAAGRRGERQEYFELIAGDAASNDIFEGIDTSWGRISASGDVAKKIASIIDSFDSSNPAASLPALLDLYDEMEKLGDNVWAEQKKKELLTVIRLSAGLWMETIAEDYSAAPGDTVPVRTTLVNRSGVEIRLESIDFASSQTDTTLNVLLANNTPRTVESQLTIPHDIPTSQPYWLGDNSTIGRFELIDSTMALLAENTPSLEANVTLNIAGRRINYRLPLLHRWTDRVKGELYRSFEIRPALTLDIDENVIIFPDGEAKDIRVTVKSHTTKASGEIRLAVQDGWKIEPESIPFSHESRYAEQQFVFTVTPPPGASLTELRAEATMNGRVYDRALVEIVHPHIRQQVYFPKSAVKAVRLDIEKRGRKIGYVVGAGDDIPQALSALSYDVQLIDDAALGNGGLSDFDAIVTGVRAFNTRDRLPHAHQSLMDYVKKGGTLVVQYNVTAGLLTDTYGPYPLTIGRERVTVENAPVTILAPDHQLMNFPNRLGPQDFEGWVQERGLYFPSKWDDHYETVIEANDPGESSKKSGILFARYGEGVFIYTGYSWFRQLPAGVPGAYRLFVNMLSAGDYDEK